MNYKPIIIVPGEPNSIFLEIYFKTILKKKIKSPIIIICSYKLLVLQMKKLRYNFKINLIDENKITSQLKKNQINLLNVNYNIKKAFEKISSKSNKYIENCFKLALELLDKGITNKFINGPISKKHFLKNKYLGVTEYLAKKTDTKKFAMLIYNQNLSVSPITTHLPIKLVSKKLNIKMIIEKIKLINNFYKKTLKTKPQIAVTGLNPHCESIHSYNEDLKIIKPSINYLKNTGLKINGPFSADTIFLYKNRRYFDVIIGMYHDQVLTPIKTLYEYDAINITLGLPFIRISPDHGPNERMIGKNLSNPLSLIKAITFLDKN
jgi:4-hydroxythreonine-4-phosphate dehydrogenase